MYKHAQSPTATQQQRATTAAMMMRRSVRSCAVGAGVGNGVGELVGTWVGDGVGARVGAGVGDGTGSGVGAGTGNAVGGVVGAWVGKREGSGVGASTGSGDGQDVICCVLSTPDTLTESSEVTPAVAASLASDVAKSPELTASDTTVVTESAVALKASNPVIVTWKSRLASKDWSRLRRREICVQSPAWTVAPLIVAAVAAANTAASSAPSAKEREMRARAAKGQHRRPCSSSTSISLPLGSEPGGHSQNAHVAQSKVTVSETARSTVSLTPPPQPQHMSVAVKSSSS